MTSRQSLQHELVNVSYSTETVKLEKPPGTRNFGMTTNARCVFVILSRLGDFVPFMSEASTAHWLSEGTTILVQSIVYYNSDQIYNWNIFGFGDVFKSNKNIFIVKTKICMYMLSLRTRPSKTSTSRSNEKLTKGDSLLYEYILVFKVLSRKC